MLCTQAHDTQFSNVPVAVALTFDCNFDETVGSSSARAKFDAQVRDDVSATLGVAKEAIEVLCHQRGSVIAEVVLKKVDGSSTMQATAALADELVQQAKDPESSLRQKAVGKLARRAEVHGPVAEPVLDILREFVTQGRHDAAETLTQQAEMAQSLKRQAEMANQVAQAKQRLKQQAERTIKKMLRIHLAIAFDSYHHRVVEKKRKRELCLRVVLRMQHRALAGAFDMFSGTVEQLASHRRVVERAISRWRSPAMTTAMWAWMEYMEMIAVERTMEALEQTKNQVSGAAELEKGELKRMVESEKERRIAQAQRIVQRLQESQVSSE
jgi:hypothetical protein